MFARHLMSSVTVAAGARWQTSDIGQYAPGVNNLGISPGQLVTFELDRAAGYLYRTPTNTNDTINHVGNVAANGRVAVVRTLNGSLGFHVYATDKTGIVGPPVASGPIRSLSGYTPFLLTESGRSFYRATQIGGSGSTLYRYDVVYVDQASGVAYPMGSVYGTLTSGAVIYPGIHGAYVGDGMVVCAGDYLGYQSPQNATWYNTIAASNGRASRATVPRQVFDDSGNAAFLRLRAAAAPETLAFAPWRRPMTSGTRVRGMTIKHGVPIGAPVSYVRRGVAYIPVTVRVDEVEIGPSTGTGTVSGQAVSYHKMSGYYSTYYGVIVIDGGTVTFIKTAEAFTDEAFDLSQYLNADGSPTGEYIATAFGRWVSPSSSPSPKAGSAPLMVTINNIITLPLNSAGNTSGSANAPFNVTDLAGVFVRTGKFPPDNFGFLLLSNADVLIGSGTRTYGAKGYASYDLGTTWVLVQFWGPRGSTNPSPSNPQFLPTTSELMTMGKLFYT